MVSIHISGNVFYEYDDYAEYLSIKNPVTGAIHGLYLKNIEPEDIYNFYVYYKKCKNKHTALRKRKKENQ